MISTHFVVKKMLTPCAVFFEMDQIGAASDQKFYISDSRGVEEQWGQLEPCYVGESDLFVWTQGRGHGT